MDDGVAGSAAVQGELWGTRASWWADIQECLCRPLFEAVLRQTEVGPGTALLDVGCGSGMLCQIAAGRGARVTGIDASPALIGIARARTPRGDFHTGEMEALPFADRSFDVVTGMNSFQYAASPVHALREAARVVKNGGRVAIGVWGRPEDCDSAAYLAALGKLMPTPPPGAQGPFAFSGEEVLKNLAAAAGIEPIAIDDVDCRWSYPSEEILLRGLLSAGPARRAIQASSEDRAREATLTALAPFRTETGGYCLNNKFRYLVGVARG